MRVLIVFAIVFGLALAQAPTPKAWPKTWTSNFVETMTMPLRGTSVTKGKWYYDASGKFRIDRENGNIDRYCGLTNYFKNIPCTQIVTNGWRYLIYPTQKYCCKCCAAENGCGIVKQDFFKNGVYEPTLTKVGDAQVHSWNVKGSQSNIYAQTANGGIPSRFYQEPQSDMIFDTKSYSETIGNPSIFNLPTDHGNCNDFCPWYSICTAVRQVKM